jgi:hypothetical protein
VIHIEGSCQSSSGNWSTIGYGILSDLPLFPSDGISAVVVAGASIHVAMSTMIGAWSAFTLRNFLSRDRIDDSVNLMVKLPILSSS